MEKYSLYKVGVLCSFIWILFSCSSVKYVPEDDYLLNKNRIHLYSDELSSSELKKIVRQSPNTTILGLFRFHLGLYNLSGRNESRKLNKWLRSIGEAPVIYDSVAKERTISQMELYLQNKGFYESRVRDSVVLKKRRAEVHYRIETPRSTRINEVCFFTSKNDEMLSEDRRINRVKQLIKEDSVHSLLKSGRRMDVELLEKERERITMMLKERGYYNFSKRYIHFYADTLKEPKKANLLVSLLDQGIDENVFRKFSIGDMIINLDYDPLLSSGDEQYQEFVYQNCIIRYRDKLKINPKLIIESMLFKSGDVYNLKKVNESYSRLQTLGIFKFINILFEEDATDSNKLLCRVRLTPSKRQSYNVFLEGTNNSGNIGVGGNFAYEHRNLFKGGENLTFDLWGALKKEQIAKDNFFNTTELGAEVKLVTPQFWLPVFRLEEFRRRYAPRTSVSFSYSNELTPFYKRSIVSSRFGYLWQQDKKRWKYGFDLIDLNYVFMNDVDQAFIDGLKSKSIQSAYTSHMILSSNFTTTYSNQTRGSKLSHAYFRGNIETSGNFLNAVSQLANAPNKSDGNEERFYEIFHVRYAQFVKFDGEYRYHQYINKANTVVYRLFAGVGYPYGNMRVLPFEEAYFCGGANGIRAWNSRTLGPGTFDNEDNYPNSVGDFKLEANIEYRFKLFWLLEGALFMDAGNVWNINKVESRSETKLRSDFYRQIAVGTGIGVRLDVNFFLLRFDLGLKMIDPIQPKDRRFVLFNDNGGFNRSVFNIAIGYPF